MHRDFCDLSSTKYLSLDWSDELNQWILRHPLEVRWRSGKIEVPAGFVTDLSSIPEAARGIIPQIGTHNIPSVVHDWCYENRWSDRKTSDYLFLLLMKEHGVPWLRRNVMYAAVRVFGKGVWDD